MKPLSIEELKALEVGDWVWIVREGYAIGTYYKKFCNDKNEFTPLGLFDARLFYSHYGKKWIAYKNKEQAEATGEIVELPCKVGDKTYYIATHYGENGLEYDDVRETKFTYSVYEDWGNLHFATREEAERRLAELRGEK